MFHRKRSSNSVIYSFSLRIIKAGFPLPYNKHIGPESSDAVVKRGNTDGMIEAVIKDRVQKFRPRPQCAHDTAGAEKKVSLDTPRSQYTNRDNLWLTHAIYTR